ncbi:SDR family NAD(P)-dependent oxidoreductase [Mycolicibacterium baixiangningiae]|uniref:SDR family NAD(P)-dependent oxidoreductase n=1 Tax=Mycolicibacterium baixiangningiae TaxID=2761578 RepID=UPI0018D188AE|nr:SDR family oxidoreductase [Mycolicibacterium baixiangningiae]
MTALEGRRALVTGGGTGIGYGCAEALATIGAMVTIAGRREDILAAAGERLSASTGATVRSVVCDVTDEEQVAHAVTTAADGGNLDVLVANAGTGFVGTILELPPEGWDFAYRLNIVGTALCIKHAGQLMKDRGGGSVIVVSSTSATKVQPWMAPYNVSKAALDMLVRCAAVELSPHGIRVNGIQPGFIPTEMLASLSSEQLTDTLTRATPLGRAGTPADIGHAVTFLAGEQASWITGQVFGVDGGLNIPVMPSMAAIAETVYGHDYVAAQPLPDFTALNGPEETP